MRQKSILFKAQYYGFVSIKALLTSLGSLLCLVGSVGSVFAVLSIDGILLLRLFCCLLDFSMVEYKSAIVILMCVLAGFISLILAFLGRNLLRAAHQMGSAILFTRETTRQLPAAASLVRPCFEPDLILKTVLLRAAAPGQQTPLEQLVRPHSQES